MHGRRGVTRIELLVGLLAAFLLVGCFLAAMFRLRTEADMMKCRNNLKQLALAVHNYHDTFSHLPPLTDQGNGSVTGTGLASTFAILMPFIEATPRFLGPEHSPDLYHAHSSVVFTYPVKDHPYTQHGGVANYSYRLFIDPADATAKDFLDVPMNLPDGSTGYYATGSYASNGILPWGLEKRFAEAFPAGLASTILFAERPQICINADGETTYNLWGVGFYSPHMPAFATLTPTEPAELWSTNQIAPVLPLPEFEGTVPIRIGRQDAPIDVNGVSTPFQRVRPGRPCDPRLPGTPHSRGMQVAMCDGSVRVFSHETSAWVFWKACVAASE